MTAENITQSIEDRLAEIAATTAQLEISCQEIVATLAELREESAKLVGVRDILVGSNDAAPVAAKPVAKPKSAKKSKTVKVSKSPRAKLTQEVADQIRSAEGSKTSIAKKYGVSRQTVANIKFGKSWAPDEPVKTRGLTQEIADAIRSAEGTIKATAETYNVSPTTVNNIRKGRIWPAI